MPSIRQLRQRVRKNSKWSKEAMKQAMQEVQAGRLKIRQASMQFGVPKSSLSDRLTGRVAADCVQGHPQLLTPEDERSLVEYCLYNASHGCPQRKDQVVAKALAIYNDRNPHKPRTVLGQTWWINFKERNQYRLTSHIPAITDRGKKSPTRSGLLKDIPLSRLTPPDCLSSSPSSDPYLTHSLIASGRVTAELACVLSKTKTREIQNLRSSAHVLTVQQMSNVIKKVGYSAARMEARSVKQQGPEDADLEVSSSTLPGGSRLSRKGSLPFGAQPATSSGAAGPSAVFASHSASFASRSTPTSMSVSSNDQHHNIGDASNLWQTASMPPAPQSSPGSSSSTAEPTTSTSYIARKKRKLEKKILRCGRCRQSYPPNNPEGLVLWVQCDNCHKMFHTVCVSSEMDLDDDEFWCFWCLDL